MHPHCHIELLGTPRIIRADQSLTHFPRQKAVHLLAYLALHRRQPQPRERLIDLLWPDMDLPAGRDSLSTTLAALRHVLEPDGTPRGSVLSATRQHIGLDPVAVTTDVAEFERLLSEAGRAPSPAARADLLARAVALYRGEALAGIYLDWATLEAGRLHGLFADALRDWSFALEEAGEGEGARRAARRWAEADPYAEEAHLRAVTLHARAGHPGDARAAARQMERLWRQEFGAPLPAAIQFQVAALAPEKTAPRKAAPSVGRTASRRAAPPPTFVPVIPAAPRPPVPLDCFFGREAEMEWLAEWLRGGTARLATLVGLGGMGKTRLALEFARRAGSHRPCCSFFVPLADAGGPAQILPAIARALALPPGDPALLEQIASFLEAGETPTLLILDNLEQLIPRGDAPEGKSPEGKSPEGNNPEGEAARLIHSLLQAAPSLFCLCTSRVRVGLRGERLFPLDPLPVPEAGPPQPGLAALSSYAGLRLYLDRAQTVRPDFGLTPDNAPAVAALCRLLDGSPLALELAASWVRVLPPRAMWERLTREAGDGALEAGDGAGGGRGSLREALDWSWRLLRPEARRFLAQVSVFRGGWTREAAEAVCGERDVLPATAALMEASLVRASEDGEGRVRCHLLETVRRYARERLAEAGEWQDCRAWHTDCFLALAEAAAAQMGGRGQVRWLDALDAERDNLCAALERCREDPAQAARGLRLAAALLPFWRARGYLKEGTEQIAALLALPGAAGRTSARAAALNGMGGLAMLQSDYGAAAACHEEALHICRDATDRAGEAVALHGLGNIAFYRQEYAAARPLFESSLTLRGDDAGLAVSWHSLGSVALREERHDEAAACYERALHLRCRCGDEIGMALTWGGLGQVALAREDYAAAARFTRDALRLFDETGQRWTASLCLNALSLIAHAQGRWDQEAHLLGAALEVRERFNFRLPPAERTGQEERIAELRARMGGAAFEAALAAGRSLSWEQAVAAALAAPA